tara:strand:- start:146 stop:520 length:375 start_codon:yes stop_codon:yes gene_type:complete
MTYIVEYFWQILATCVSPLAGFAVGQHYKVSQPERPSATRIALVAGGVTALMSSWLWPGTLEESAKIGVLFGIIQPIVVLAWFAAAKKFTPKTAESLTGSGSDLTIVPGIRIRNKREDATQPRD